MMVNLPLSETFWVRGAASFTKREGFDYNTHLGTRVNGRDLHTTRISAVWEPTDRFRANLIWERFGEDDNRSRTGKQLCTTDPGLSQVGSVTNISPLFQGRMSQGCLPSSLYADAAYGTPNGTGMSHVHALTFLVGRRDSSIFSPTLPFLPAGENPYEGVVQSKNLREISTSYDPVFRASNDVVQFNLSYDIGEKLTLHSQTLYTKDDYYSTQDYNRFIPSMVFLNTSDLYGAASPALTYSPMAPGGFYNDPQLGAHDRMISADLSVSDNRQWYQELRLQGSILVLVLTI
jgi:iron complex outermembrane receptor protein